MTAKADASGSVLKGTVVEWLTDEGYGFLNVVGRQQHVFVPRRALPPGMGDLRVGQRVRFVLAIDRSERPYASQIEMIRPSEIREPVNPQSGEGTC